jgi:hypothetical protein
MKRIIIVIATMFALNVTSHAQKRFQNMVGTWQIAGEQNSGGTLEIIDSSTIILKYMGEEKKLIGCKLDFSKSPFWFDFSAQDSASVMNVKSIVEFVNDDMLKWQLFVDEDRADHFSSTKGELLYLRRAKPKTKVAANTPND